MFDDNRYVLDDAILTVAYFHRDSVTSCKKIKKDCDKKDCKEIKKDYGKKQTIENDCDKKDCEKTSCY